MTHIWLATRNAHKTREFAEMLGEDFALTDLSERSDISAVVENGATFEENARFKAVAVSSHLPGLVLADDSGLEVNSLGGAPGLFSARYAGPNATDAANRQKLLDALASTAEFHRAARFRCALALARAGVVVATFDGAVKGTIVRAERGAGGFGYDPLFQPNGYTKTFAELSATQKHTLSHRGRAVRKLREFLKAAQLEE